MPSCSVKWCSNHTSICSLKLKNGVSFHRFPKDEATCQKWVEAVRFERRDPWWTSTNASRICSIHFKESDITSTPCKVNILAKTAVPVCTMIWYDDNENKVTIKTSIEKINTDTTILKTYERKKTNTNVLKESKVNMSYNWNKESNKMSKTNRSVISNMTPCPLFQDNVLLPKLLKTLEESKTLHLKEDLEPNSIKNIGLKTNANVNLTAVQKKSVLTELNKQEYVISCADQCCKSEVLVKLNDNTNLILDEDLSNDGDIIFKESNKVSNEPNTRIWDNFKKVNLKELKSNENKEPNQEVNISSNSGTVIEKIINGNANISKSFVGKMLKTYLPKRKVKINEKSMRETYNILNKNKDILRSNTMGKALNTVKCKEVNNIIVDKSSKEDFSKNFNTGMFIKNNIMANLQSIKRLQGINKQKNVKKYFLKRKSKLFNRPKLREQNKLTVGLLPNIDTKSNMAHINEFLTNQSRIDNIKETNTAVYDKIISELFETSKNVGNVSYTSSNGNHQEKKEKNMISTLDKETNNTHDILDLNTNIYGDLNTLTGLELCNVVSSGLNDEINTDVNIDKTVIHASFTQFNKNIVSESNQQVSILNNINMPMKHSDYMPSESLLNLNTEINRNIVTQCNKDMYYDEIFSNDVIVLSNNELQNLETSVEKNIISETKTVQFTELKKHLSMPLKVDSPSKSYTNNVTDIIKKYKQVQDQEHNTEVDTNTSIAVNDLVISLRSKFNTDAGKETEPNVTNFKQSKSILLDEGITNISSESNSRDNMDFVTNFKRVSNTTREIEFNKPNISDITTACNKTVGKDMPNLYSVGNLELYGEVKIGCTDEMNTIFNTVKTDINADFVQYNENKAMESNQQLPIMNKNILMNHSDHMISDSHYHLHTEMNSNITTQGNKNVCNEIITNNAVILSKNELENLKPSVVSNIVNETKKDKFTELKTYLSIKPKLDCHSELCTNTLSDTDKSLCSKYDSTMSTAIIKENIQISDQEHGAEFYKNKSIDVNDIVTSIQSNTNKETTREIESNVTSSKHCNSIFNEELIKNILPETTNKNVNAINNFITDSNKTIPTSNKNMIIDNNVCKFPEKDMPELNTVIPSEFPISNTEILNNKDLVHRKLDKNFVNVLPMSDDQHTVVNEHLDVVNSILNRDIAEFDLSLLLSDNPIPDEDIQNVDNNSNYSSLDGFGGSPTWIQLSTSEMPKIIDDILDQDSPFLENLDLFNKVNQFDMDKEANKKDNEIKKTDKEKYSTSNVGQYDRNIMNIFCETGKQCAKNSIAEIDKQLIVEFSDSTIRSNKTSLDQRNDSCNENKVSQSKKITTEKCYVSCDEQTDKQILKQYLQSNNEQCNKNNLHQIVDKCNDHSDKEIQCANKNLSQARKKNNFDSKTNQIDDSNINKFIRPYLEQSEESHKEQDGLAINNLNDEVLNDVNILEPTKKQFDKQSNDQRYQTSFGKLKSIKESIPKPKIDNQVILGSSSPEQHNQFSDNFNEKRNEEINNVSNKDHTGESVRELNIGKLKNAIFEKCYDTECRNNCKHQKYNSNTASHKKERFKKERNYTPYDVLYKQQFKKPSIDNFNKQLSEGSLDQNIKQKGFLERHKLLHNVKYITKYKKIAIDHIPGQYLELRWKESLGKSNTLSQEGCKRKCSDLGLDRRKILCSESTNNFSQQTMAECPECGYSTDDNDLMNYQSNVDLRITKPLSIINKDMLISLRDIETENNNQKNRVELESVYAMELAYITAIQALERKLKQKNAISEYRLRRVNNLTKINNTLINAFLS